MNKLKHKVLEYSIYEGEEDFMIGDETIRVKVMGEEDDQYIQISQFDDSLECGEAKMDFSFEEIYKVVEIVKKLETQ